MERVKRVQCVHIQTPAFDESVDYYEQGFGLTLLDNDGQIARLAGARGGPKILQIVRDEKPRLAGMTMTMTSVKALNAARAAIVAKGIKVEEAQGEGAFAVTDPDGHRVEVVLDQGDPDERPTADGKSLFISHCVLNTPDHDRLLAFYEDVLGFVEVDRYEKNLLTFLKADQPQHHCIGICTGEASALNHFSTDVGSIDALMRSVGRMKQLGYEPAWGPGRHGPGGNVFCYFEDPTGFVAEFTCDVLQIDDVSAYQGKEWLRVPENANVWGTGGPSPRAVDLMSGRM